MTTNRIKSLAGKQIFSAKKWHDLRHSKQIVSISMTGKTEPKKKGVKFSVVFNDGDNRNSIEVFF